ncbi:hypothetical protein [Emticicia sp. W12TSBA100-4]
MMALFDDIDKHPVASIAAIVWVIGVALVVQGLLNPHKVDKDDRYF